MTTKSPLANVLSGVLGGLIVLVIGAVLIATDVIDTGGTQTVVRETSITQPTATSTGTEGRSVRDIYKQEGRGVVFIQSNGVSTDSGSPFGAPQQGTATGSGFVVDGDGTIITNAHVVEGADSVQVRFADNGDFIDADVKGVDVDTDIAVLKIDPSKVSGGLTPIPLGDSSKLQVGDPVIAIGNPFGYSRTVTTGIVSGLERDIQAPNGFQIDRVLQTDAPINPGNSGGPLLDTRGRVVGVNSQIATAGARGSIGIGFAVPADAVRSVLPRLKAGERIERAFIGLTSSADPRGGARVRDVTKGGPADQAGLSAAGDVIVGIDGRPVRDPGDVSAAVTRLKPGDSVRVTVRRGGDRRTVRVRLTTRPERLPGGP